MRYLTQALIFLIDTALGTYLLLALLRVLFQWARADFYHPFTQLLVRLTNPVVLPLRRVIPGFFGVDWASVIVVVVLMLLKVLAAFWLAGVAAPLGAAAILALGQLLELLVYVFLIAIVLRAILSWIDPLGQHPFEGLLRSLSEPLLAPLRRALPVTGGFDWSPLAALLILEVVLIIVVQPLLDLGTRLALG